MLAETGEGLGLRVIAVIVQRYGVLPRELWDLNRISDMGARRGLTSTCSEATFTIINLTLYENEKKLKLPETLQQLKISGSKYKYSLDLLPKLRELTLEGECNSAEPLVIPASLQKLVLAYGYNVPLVFPSGSQLLELELGYDYSHPLVLPQRLQRLTFDGRSQWNFPIALPASIRSIYFGRSYDQPTVLPYGIEELGVGRAFSHDLSLPNSLRKLGWYCDCPVQIPEGVLDVTFDYAFNQPVVLPTTLKKFEFYARTYAHPMHLPDGLEELQWLVEEYEGLVLPERLQKLTWGSSSSVRLPLGLKELVLAKNALLDLLEAPGLLKVTLRETRWLHYDLPESVQEVLVHSFDMYTFTHPTILPHLILRCCNSCSLDLSQHRIHKLTIGGNSIKIKRWPQGLKELAFTADGMHGEPLRVPIGCKIVGDKRPANVIMESEGSTSDTPLEAARLNGFARAIRREKYLKQLFRDILECLVVIGIAYVLIKKWTGEDPFVALWIICKCLFGWLFGEVSPQCQGIRLW